MKEKTQTEKQSEFIEVVYLKEHEGYKPGTLAVMEKPKAEMLIKEGKAFYRINKDYNFKTSEGQLKDICLSLFLDQRKNEIAYTCAQFFLEKLEHHILTFDDTGEIYVYDNGVYNPNGEAFVKKFLQTELSELLTNHLALEVLNHIRRETFVKRANIDTPKNFVCLENGIFDLEKNELLPHNPKLVFFQKLPIEYDANTQCPLIEKFLSEVLEQKDIPVIEELAGYCLLRDYSFQNSFVFVGGGRNGKSVLLNLIRAFLGKENVSARSLHDLLSNRFAKADLFGKLANIFADLPTRDLNDTSNFKMLTGQDLIEAEKKFRDSFRFENYAKMLFSANQLSKTPEDTDAFFRRWVILNFPNEFNEENADKKLIEKLTTLQELSGFFNKAIEGLKRLQANGQFTNTVGVEEKRERYIRLSDSVKAFLMDMVQVNPEGVVIKREIYEAYTRYCREKNYPIESENKFHKGIIENFNVSDFRPKLDGQRVHCWKGITVDGVRDAQDVRAKTNLSKKTEGATLNDFKNNT